MLNPINYIEKEFKCIRPIVAHWGVILKENKYYKVIKSGTRKTIICIDRKSYWDGFPSIPKYKDRSEMTEEEIKLESKKSKERMWICRELSDKYHMEIEVNYIKVESEFKGGEIFYIESIKDIIKKYKLDDSKKIGWTSTHTIFKDYFDIKGLNREVRLDQLLNG